MAEYKYLFIGAGPAAFSAATAIRQTGDEGKIAMVTYETCGPYSPAALPYLFDGEMSEDNFFFKGEKLLKQLDVTLLRGHHAERLDNEKKKVTLDDGSEIFYDKLLIATGTHPDCGPVKRFGDIHEKVLRTFADYEALEEAGDVVAIYGAGLVALELAEKLARSGKQPIVIARSRLLRKYFRQEVTDLLTAGLEKEGARVYSGADIKEVLMEDGKYKIRLDNDKVIDADAFVCATGVHPTVPFSGEFTIEKGGILVNRLMQTGVTDVYAAGDVVTVPGFFTESADRFPILCEAIEQGRIAGLAMAGEAEEYRGGISSNIFRCGDEYYFSVGMTDVREGVQVLEAKTGDGEMHMYLQDGCLVGAEGRNTMEILPGTLRFLIFHRVPIEENTIPAMARDPGSTAIGLMDQYRRTEANKLIASK